MLCHADECKNLKLFMLLYASNPYAPFPSKGKRKKNRTAEPEGIKAPTTQSGRGPFHAFFVALSVMTAAWARVQNAPGLLPSVMPRALASWSSGARAGLTGCLPITA